jgi:hypothetical protein
MAAEMLMFHLSSTTPGQVWACIVGLVDMDRGLAEHAS